MFVCVFHCFSLIYLHIDNNPNYFPTFEPSAEKISEVEASLREDSNPATHYDATKEVRARGAAFYQFSTDEETRQVQMEELRKARKATEQIREESTMTGEQESKPGMEKRKRDIEERLKIIEAKRRRLQMSVSQPLADSVAAPPPNAVDNTTPKKLVSRKPRQKPQSVPLSIPQSADEFLAAVEREMMLKKQ